MLFQNRLAVALVALDIDCSHKGLAK